MTQEKASLSLPVSSERAESLSINHQPPVCVKMVPQTASCSAGKTSFGLSALFNRKSSIFSLVTQLDYSVQVSKLMHWIEIFPKTGDFVNMWTSSNLRSPEYCYCYCFTTKSTVVRKDLVTNKCFVLQNSDQLFCRLAVWAVEPGYYRIKPRPLQ